MARSIVLFLASVLMHIMAAGGDETVAETQRTCSNYTCDNYYSKACCLQYKRVLFKTTHGEYTGKKKSITARALWQVLGCLVCQQQISAIVLI